jgi:hypothetical protein
VTVRLSPAGAIMMEGICPSEDAEVLLQLLLAHPAPVVDWSACEGAHTAVIQVLMAAGPALRGPPAGGSLRDWVQPLLTRDRGNDR